MLNFRREKRQLVIVSKPQKNKGKRDFVISYDVTSRDSHFEDNVQSNTSKPDVYVFVRARRMQKDTIRSCWHARDIKFSHGQMQ